MSPAPTLSLIIATRNRRDSLQRLLPLLIPMASRDREFIFVDNGSIDGTAELLNEMKSLGHIRSIHEPQPGKGRALNAGIAAARGELLVFSDDDIEPDPTWLDELSKAAERHPDVVAFGGRILADANDVPCWIRESRNLQEILLTEHDLGNEVRQYPPNRFPVGPSMMIRRRALRDQPSPWSPEFGPGCAVPVGDERVLFCRIDQGGGRKRIYVGSSVVRHRIEGRQLRLLPALRRCYWGGYSGGLSMSLFPAQSEPDEEKPPMFRVLRKTKSAQELVCVIARAIGYVAGRWRGRKAQS
jgi:glycosyltransferase involved in cell wall biosynthesis